jgi:hypothetical protein
VLVICATTFLLVSGFLLLVIGLIQLFANGSTTGVEYPLYGVGLMLLTIGTMLIPFTLLKIKSLRSSSLGLVMVIKPTGSHLPVLLPVLVILWSVVLLTGFFLIDAGKIASLFMPLLSILGIILPICIYLFLATRNVDSIPLSRGWGSLGSGLTIAPLLGIFLEFGSLTLVFTFIMVFMMQDSSLLTGLEIAATRLTSGQENPEILSNMLAAFIRHPINRFLIFSIIAGVVPIIEEIVKQIPIWLLAWRKLTPRTGLMMGTLGGAGFALTESLLSVSVIGGSDQWVYQIIGRAGAGLMHMITGALCGWGLSSAIEGKSYIKAILTYLTSVIIHGLWNAMATWEGLGRIANPSTLTSFSFLDPNQFPLIVMGILFLLMAYILIFHKNILKD